MTEILKPDKSGEKKVAAGNIAKRKSVCMGGGMVVGARKGGKVSTV